MFSRGPQQLPVTSLAALPPPSSNPSNGDEGPACLSCRRRKLRCSREHPSCSQCMRLSCECVYDQKRQKPGLKAGAIESINQRLELLEQKLEKLDRDGYQRQSTLSNPGDVNGCIYHASLLLASHVRNAVDADSPDNSNVNAIHSDLKLNCHRSISSDDRLSRPSSRNDRGPSRKRRRISYAGLRADVRLPPSDLLPSQRVIDAVVTKYFATVHHWIPMVHESRFRARLEHDEEARKLVILLHAMVAVTLRHIDYNAEGLDTDDVSEQVQKSMDVVTLNTLDSISAENAQALIMLCFERMGSGDWAKAWSLVGSLTRTVDYLQLTNEPGALQNQPLLAPVTPMADPKGNAEAEERKRIFWNTFLLDRLCSVTCGWTTGLTSDNVSRQLPCNGGIWRRGEEATTPYFGLWEKSQAKMGHSVAYLPTHRASPNDKSQHPNSPGAPPFIDISNLGAVAYRIEATESLSQVSSYFLQQHVNFMSRKEIGDWLTRFKELDLRLVHWKLFLPQRWRDSNVSKDATVRMDPNLTLAHITHNASMILLHQHIAYPSTLLSRAVSLPSSCSAETCTLAAVETAAITAKYLKYTPDIMVNCEFVFCVFVAAKVLLVHSHYYHTELAQEYFSLIENLQEMSLRWRGDRIDAASQPVEFEIRTANLDLAGRYALVLRKYHSRCQEDPTVAADILQNSAATALFGSDKDITIRPTIDTLNQSTPIVGNSESQFQEDTAPGVLRAGSAPVQPSFHPDSDQDNTERSQLRPPAVLTRTPSANQLVPYTSNTATVNGYYTGYATSTVVGPPACTPDSQDNLLAMSDTLMGQNFQNMDRVITVDGADFSFQNFDLADPGFVYGGFEMHSN